MKKLILISALLLIVGCSEEPNTYSDEAINDAMRSIAEKWSKELPQVIDRTTTLMSVSVNTPRTMTYKYYMDSSLIVVSLTEMEDIALTVAVNQFCTDPKQEFARENNVTHEHRYFDLANSYLFSMSVSNADCI